MVLRAPACALFAWIVLVGCGGGDATAPGGSQGSSSGAVASSSTAGGAGPGSSTATGTGTTTATGSGGAATSSSAGGGGASSAGSGGAGGGPSGSGGGGCADTTITVSPKMAKLTVVNGMAQTQQFTATQCGMDVTATATWSFDRPDLADNAPKGLLTPKGTNGGAGTLTVSRLAEQDTAAVEIHIEKTDDGGLTPQQIANFNNPLAPDPNMTIVYPYDQTVFPLGMLPPVVQWNGGAAGDVYKLVLTEKYYVYTAYFLAPPPSNHLVADAVWAAICASGVDPFTDPLGLSLQRQTLAVTYLPKTQTWHVARARLAGSVYYWELPDQGAGNGRILRISPGSAVADEFFKPNTCWGCHTLSRDGKTLAAEFNDGNGPLYTVDVSKPNAVYGPINPNAPAGNYVFSAFNEKGDKLLASDNTLFDPSAATLKIISSQNGAVLNPSAIAPGCGEPAWSPDGTMLAATCGYSGGGWTFDAMTSNLTVADIAPDGVTVGVPKIIVPTTDQSMGRPAYPNFSPGSGLIAYGRTTQGSRSIGNGTLHIIAPDGSGGKQLVTAGSDLRSFNPTFAPLRTGGFYWIAFITRRDYGNTIVGMDRQQLWITAVDDPPSALDPSHPPFYLRGQEMTEKSENAYWALDPCKATGDSCAEGYECCAGFCEPDPNNVAQSICTIPMMNQCAGEFDACTTAADCCDPAAECVDGYCQTHF